MMPLKIGVTGGIGSGKTTACKVFEQLGIPVYSADNEAKLLLVKDKFIVDNITAIFGKDIYNSNGAVNRPALSAIVFNDPVALDKLNAIVHPRVRQHFLNWAATQATPYIIKEAAIMFESGAYKDLDAVINISAPEELRIERAMNRDEVGADIIKARIDKQLTEEERCSRSQYVIINDDTQLVVPQIIALHQSLLNQALNAHR